MKRRISTTIRCPTTLRNLCIHPKDKAELKEGVYKLKCQGCVGCYVDVTKRKLSLDVKEHRTVVDNTVRDRVFTQGKGKQSETETERNHC